jgi:hypothetical protein
MINNTNASMTKDRLVNILAIMFLFITLIFGILEIGIGAYAGYLHEQTNRTELSTSDNFGIIEYICGSMLCCCFTTPMGIMISMTCFGIGKMARTSRLIGEGKEVSNQFNNVWYLSRENTIEQFKIMAYEDVGRLEIQENTIVYTGRKGSVIIRKISKIKYGKQGRDFMNNWVQIEYGDNQKAFFADGSVLGWKGFFGGTKILFAAINKGLQMKE